MDFEYYDITDTTINLSQIQSLINSTFEYLTGDFFVEQLPRVTFSELKKHAEKKQLIIGKSKDTLICCAILVVSKHPVNGKICGGLNALSVNKNYQRKGVAKELYKFVATEFLRLEIELQTGFVIVPNNDELMKTHPSRFMISWYEKLGLKVSKTVVVKNGDSYFAENEVKWEFFENFCQLLKPDGVRLFYYDVEVDKIIHKLL